MDYGLEMFVLNIFMITFTNLVSKSNYNNTFPWRNQVTKQKL